MEKVEELLNSFDVELIELGVNMALGMGISIFDLLGHMKDGFTIKMIDGQHRVVHETFKDFSAKMESMLMWGIPKKVPLSRKSY